MARYVDGFLIAVPRKKLGAYRRMSRSAGKIWRKYGALEYIESVGDDLKGMPGGLRFSATVKARPGETVVFSWILYKSKAHRNRVNAKVMKDPRILKMMDPTKMPFDDKRMAYGGFKVLVDL